MTDDEVLARPDWVHLASAVVEAGRGSVALHVRGPGMEGRALFDLTRSVLEDARRSGAKVVVNDRADVALAADADGVHLGHRSVGAARVRASVFPRGVIGVSCHSSEDVDAALADGADFAFAGTVFRTPSHPGRAGIEVEGFTEIAAGREGFPVLAIGGVAVDDARRLVSAGAYGVAVVRGVWDASDPAAATMAYLDGMSEKQTDRADAGGTRG